MLEDRGLLRLGRLAAAVSALILVLNASALAGDRDAVLRERVGGGNIVSHLTGAPTANLYDALGTIGAKLGRMDSYGWRDENHVPTPHDFDAAMMEAYRHGITPIILLEYEGSYQELDPPQPIGSYDDWFAAGSAMARRFRPGGDWGRENGIEDFGVTVFTAVNEPDVQASIPQDAYHDALAGFADGVHSVESDLKVVPGGFAACNVDGDATLRGYGPAIGDLLESGQLDGIDLHTYYNARWFPLTKGREFSAQSCFDRIKETLGITRDIRFYSTEFNVARDEMWSDPAELGSLFLTALWDNLGVVGKDGEPVTVFAFPWNLSDTGRIEGPAYAMAAAENPWAPDVRAEVLQRVLSIAGDMRIVSSDPFHAGTLHLKGDDAELYVWHDRDGWTDRPGAAWTVDLPAWARHVEVWGWDGRRRRVVAEPGPFTTRGLKTGETHMLLVTK